MKKIKQFKAFMIFVLMGFIVFSPISSLIIIDYLGFPMSMPEVLLIPFLYLTKDKLKTIHFNKKIFLNLSIISAFLLVLGLLKYDIFSLLSMYRGYLYLFIFYCSFDSQNAYTEYNILYVCFGSILGWMIEAIYNTRMYMLSSSDLTYSYGLMLAIPLFLSISFRKGRNLLLIVGIVVILITILFAGLRRLLFIFIFSLFIVYLLNSLRAIKEILTKALMVIPIILIVYFNYDAIGEEVRKVSPQAYHRIFARTEITVSEGGQDRDRQTNFTNFVDNFTGYMFPHGFIGNDTSQSHAVSWMDFPLSGIAWTISLPFTIILLFFFMRRAKNVLFKYLKKSDDEAFVFFVSFITIFLLLFLEGTFITYPYATPITGLCLGKITMLSKKIKS